MLRIYFKYDRTLLTQFCHGANEGLRMFFRTVPSLNHGILGMIMVSHTFGDYARSHPHLHAIAAPTQHIPEKNFQMVRHGTWPELFEGAGIRAEAGERGSKPES